MPTQIQALTEGWDLAGWLTAQGYNVTFETNGTNICYLGTNPQFDVLAYLAGLGFTVMTSITRASICCAPVVQILDAAQQLTVRTELENQTLGLVRFFDDPQFITVAEDLNEAQLSAVANELSVNNGFYLGAVPL